MISSSRAKWPRGVLGVLASVVLLLAWARLQAQEVSTTGQAEGGTAQVALVEIDSIIHPVAAEFILEALEEADRSQAQALVLKLNTPGGLLSSTRQIFTAMLEARTPVVVYVAPSGAQAASAGFFLLMAADLAAMAPGTNTGAAHPVGGQGEEIEGVMGEKVEQDAAATIRSLAARMGRDEKLAEEAVVDSRSFTAEEALESGLIDVIAASTPRLLQEISGRQVHKADGAEHTLETTNAEIRRLEMSVFQKLRSTLAHPNIAYLLLTLGGLGLYAELSNPGSILPGVLGAICIILGFYGLSVLPLNYAGVALLLLAALFFLAEIKVPSYGLLTVGGVVSLVLGSTMLFRSVDPAVRVSLQLIFSLAGIIAVIVGLLASMAFRAHRSRVLTGQEGLVHERGTARSNLEPGGKITVHGEIWKAEADAPVVEGESVEVVAVEGMTLKVRPLRS